MRLRWAPCNAEAEKCYDGGWRRNREADGEPTIVTAIPYMFALSTSTPDPSTRVLQSLGSIAA